MLIISARPLYKTISYQSLSAIIPTTYSTITPMATPCIFITVILLMACCLQSSTIATSNDSHPVPSPADSTSLTASITRKLVFPDFKDEEKTDAITLLGSAAVDRNSGVIKIPGSTSHSPQDLANQAGRALYSFPFRMMDPETGKTSSFHTSFSFRITKLAEHSNGTSDSGLTFLIVPDELTVGRNGGWLGMMNDACDETYKPFAIEFDTYKNEEFQDPNDHHIGVNFGSIISHQTADASLAGVSFHDGSTVRAWISYDSGKKVVDVRVAKDGDAKPSTPLLSSPLDLSKIFKEYMFVGFSGATGSTAQVHNILSWHFSSDSTGLLRMPKDETCVKRLIPKLVPNKKKAPSAFIIFCLVILVAALAFLNLACVRRKEDKGAGARLPRLAPRPLYKPRKFSLAELLEATRLFSEGEVLGYGNQGMFFKGLTDGSLVAIKRFYPDFLQQSCSDQRRVMKEIGALSRLHHPNLVPLRGWCADKGELLLAYDYMPNGSLDQWLSSKVVFPWVRRYKVVKEIAGALAFLHSGLEKPIVHRNVKASNVLLDVAFRARLGDYSLAKSKGSTKWGNMDWSSHQQEGSKADATAVDVYCFGVMLFEIVTGRSSLGLQELEGNEEEKEVGLIEWVWTLHERGNLMEAIDEDLVNGAGRYYTWESEIASVLMIGLLCTMEDSSARPSMSEVNKYLSGEASLPEVPTSRKPVMIYPDHSPDYSPCHTFALCTPLELHISSSFSSHLHKQSLPHDPNTKGFSI